MKVVVAPDSFKRSLSAQAAAAAIAAGVKRACPDAVIDLAPIADGGEGTVDCMLAAVGGRKVGVVVHDPLGHLVNAFYGLLDDGTVVIEVAAAVGLGLIGEADVDPLQSNTVGVGELIRAALGAGLRRFVIGLGGSATNDAGIGMLYALGARFYDAAGAELAPTPQACLSLERLELADLHPDLGDATIRVACDVSNPLCGPTGATAVYGPQKGVTAELVPVLDGVLARFAMAVEVNRGVAVEALAGAGAAGGLGAAFIGVLGADLVQGIDLVMDLLAFDERVADADLVITGEGRTDAQTVHGKAVFGVATRARAAGVPVICLSGSVAEDAYVLYQHGVTALLAIAPGPITLLQSMRSTGDYLAATAESSVRIFSARRGT